MSVFSSIPFASQTVYRVEFPPKSLPRPVLEKAKQGNEIFQPMDPFPRKQPERQTRIEAIHQKIRERYPSLMGHFIGGIDFGLVENLLKQDGKSCYCRDYDGGAELKLSEMSKTLSLPNDWQTPVTTQQTSFRPPHIWGDIQSSKPFIPSQNLVPNQKERKILGTTTGESNYMATHGRVAAKMLRK